MNDKELFELAEKCGVVITYGQGVPLKAFYRAAFNAGLEAGAKEARSAWHDDAIAIADSIEALEMKP